MKQEKLHPAIIVLTCFAASQLSLDGKFLAQLLRNSARSRKSSARQKGQLRTLARAAQNIQAAKDKAIAEESKLSKEEILRVVEQAGDDDQTLQ